MMRDSSLKPLSCLSHGLVSLGEQSQVVCSTKVKDSAADVGDTITSIVQVWKENKLNMEFGVQPKKHSTLLKSGAS